LIDDFLPILAYFSTILGYNYLVKKVVEKIAVGGIVIHEGKVLIIQRAADDDYMPGLWEIPSGKREPEHLQGGTFKGYAEYI
jgi:hypothetical protein